MLGELVLDQDQAGAAVDVKGEVGRGLAAAAHAAGFTKQSGGLEVYVLFLVLEVQLVDGLHVRRNMLAQEAGQQLLAFRCRAEGEVEVGALNPGAVEVVLALMRLDLVVKQIVRQGIGRAIADAGPERLLPFVARKNPRARKAVLRTEFGADVVAGVVSPRDLMNTHLIIVGIVACVNRLHLTATPHGTSYKRTHNIGHSHSGVVRPENDRGSPAE